MSRNYLESIISFQPWILLRIQSSTVWPINSSSTYSTETKRESEVLSSIRHNNNANRRWLAVWRYDSYRQSNLPSLLKWVGTYILKSIRGKKSSYNLSMLVRLQSAGQVQWSWSAWDLISIVNIAPNKRLTMSQWIINCLVFFYLLASLVIQGSTRSVDCH